MTAKILLPKTTTTCAGSSEGAEKAGYKVFSYDNGASAMTGFAKNPFASPDRYASCRRMDGIELARRATELDPDLK